MQDQVRGFRFELSELKYYKKQVVKTSLKKKKKRIEKC